MPSYVIIADHSPDICPSANARTRARAKEGLGPEALPKALADHGVSFVLEPMHLDPGHTTLAIVTAANIESVVRFANDTGLVQWNTVNVYPTTPIGELMANVDDTPAIFD